MKLAKKALAIVLTMMAMLVALSAQTPRSEKDDRNLAPTVGTGGPVGGPTGLFTVYDGQTLRKGEYTFSAAYSNFDRDPGNVDIVEVPVSFQIGLNDHLELFFTTDAYRGVKVNSPQNLSGFYLPNSRLRIGSGFVSAGAIILAPQGPGTSQFANTAVFRPQQTAQNFGQPFVQFPYVGGAMGNFGYTLPSPAVTSGSIFGYSTFTPTISAPRAGGNGADLFPGLGSSYGGILPGIVLQTTTLASGPLGSMLNTAPTAFTVAPSYLPDAPFLNREYGESAFNTFNAGAKWRWTGPNSPVGVGVVAFYRWYADTASDASGFNQLQRGASPGGSRGDVGVVLFADSRIRKWLNVSANLGYIYNSSPRGEFPNGTFTLLDRGDEVQAAVGIDMPVNRYFQVIGEARTNQYVGGRTPNAFENSPMDLLAGVRIFPARWMSMSLAYRYHANQQDRNSLEDDTFTATSLVVGRTTPTSALTVTGGVPSVFRTSNDPHGFIVGGSIGRRNKRGITPPDNKPADVTDIEISDTEVITPCPAGTRSKTIGCNDNQSVNVMTKATDAEGDKLVYDYVVSGGRIVGSGQSVGWDLSGAKPGTYTITSKVDDGCGFCGKPQTKTITVKACSDCEPLCECPSLSVSGPSSLTKAGESMNFNANVSGGTGDCSTTYNWTVSNGTITSGQGTPSITVATTSDMQGQSVIASVDAGGSCFCTDCPRTGNATGQIEEKPPIKEARKIDEYPKAENDDVKAKIDNLYIELNNDPSATGYVVLYGNAKQIAAQRKQIEGAISFRQYDRSRVVIVTGAGPMQTQLWVVPAGATPPTP